MINLKFHCDIDASMLAVQASSAQNLMDEVREDKMAGWVSLPENYDKDEFSRIKAAAQRIQSDSDYLVCIGIGGSYLGHKAIIDALESQIKSNTKVLYAGNSISTISTQKVLDEIGDKDFSINVISKSGTTTEPAIAFRIFKEKLIEKYGENEAYARIYATTDAESGALHDEALYNHYERFVVPNDIGGRYSVLTAVGLLPLAVAGVNIDDLMSGAREEEAALMTQLTSGTETSNEEIAGSITDAIFKYAAARHILRTRNYDVEVLSCFEPCMEYLEKWWQQLFGESEGKEDKGIFPATAIYTTDLHSLGQYMQQGRPNIFETIISFENLPAPKYTNRINPQITVPKMDENLDGLQYLEEKELGFINEKAKDATITAHSQHIPVLEVIMPDLSERSLGSLIYFFELACAISAKFEQVNPFDQPGVEAYKNEMFRLLGKPDFEG
ncbi:glucose-6-phosphate isomerase [Candidatus Saccharibacteria bacterium]|nr:glucose-6-phosphate isomerase [Candidatus Saccharibacteria bacterium]